MPNLLSDHSRWPVHRRADIPAVRAQILLIIERDDPGGEKGVRDVGFELLRGLGEVGDGFGLGGFNFVFVD